MVFSVAATTLTITLAALALAASRLTDYGLQRLRSHGPRMKQTGGVLVIAIGIWFAYLAVANPAYLLP